MPKIESAQARAKLEKWILIRQSVLLQDLQAPVIRSVVERRQCEIVDVVTNPTWFFEELKN